MRWIVVACGLWGCGANGSTAAEPAVQESALVVHSASLVYPTPCSDEHGNERVCTPPGEIEILTIVPEVLAPGTELVLVAEAGVVGPIEIIAPADPSMVMFHDREHNTAYARIVTRTDVAVPAQSEPHEDSAPIALFAVGPPASVDARARLLPMREGDPLHRIDLTGDGREDVTIENSQQPAPELSRPHEPGFRVCEEIRERVGERWRQVANRCYPMRVLVGP
jgi:hypothetical protein